MVSWIFLALSLAGAWLTLNAHWPFKHWWMFVGPSFFGGWFTTELALHHVFWQALVAAGFVAGGALQQPVGMVAALITLLSWLGLGAVTVSAYRDGARIRSALEDTLGELPPDADGVSWSRVLLPFWMGYPGVERIRNIAYVGDGRRRHRLDVYRRRDHEEKSPVVLQIHGGGWVVGSKDQQGLPLLNLLAERGNVCVAINYALSPRATWPEHLIDCKRALAWIRANIASYGGDPNFVVVTGGSAGGHLAALMALTANDASLQPGFEDVDTSVSAFVPFYGVYDWTNRFGIRGPGDGLRTLLERGVVKQRQCDASALFESASPLSRIGDHHPPAMVIHGAKDNLVPVAEARRFVASLREHGPEPVVYAELAGAHHAFDVFQSLRTQLTIRGVARFVEWVHTQPRAHAADAEAPPRLPAPSATPSAEGDHQQTDERERQHHAAERDE